ncbi:3-hydroxyisobutyryl-CoA hydrolase, mitochondrial [Symbiodinium microadriaticum]|uniref:3-hydroxyisobutyryl-CoA hydrolase n=1 Tax=Symbiodinium microadriaticum TaxID=2951 RepID=A0A1Q9CNG3_SYMMI|nr:3-hydroxyisobutyryl-CoA hydrolase, mitochondrial [Symbiodinium microadriaticum]
MEKAFKRRAKRKLARDPVDPKAKKQDWSEKVLNKREWKPSKEYNGSKVRNVPFSVAENEKIRKAIRAYCEEEGLDYAAACETLHKEKRGGAWGRIAFFADLPKRRTWAIVQRAKRILWGPHRWSQLELQILMDEACSAAKPSWVRISNLISVNPNTVRDKWRELCGGEKVKGKFSQAEDWRLRMAICQATQSLLPTKNIPWTSVQKWMPHRGYKMLMQRWYQYLMPRLSAYKDKYGMPVEPELFVRHLLRKLRKSGIDDPIEVEWTSVNIWWSASMNRNKWRELAKRVPSDLKEAGMQLQVQWWYEALECKGHRKRDKEVLKNIVSVLEAEAMQEDCESSEAMQKDWESESGSQERQPKKAPRQARTAARKARFKRGQLKDGVATLAQGAEGRDHVMTSHGLLAATRSASWRSAGRTLKLPQFIAEHRRFIRTGFFTDDADFLDPEAPLLADRVNERWRHMDDPTLQGKVLERSNVGMGMLVLNRAEGLDLPTVNELYKRLRNLEVNSLKRFVGLTATEEFGPKADAVEDENFQSSLESGDRNHNSLATGRFCIGLDPKELLLAAVYAQKHGDLAPFSKALLWNSQELSFLVADYRKPLVCHLSGAARDGGTALAGLSSYSGAYNASEISVRSCFHGLVPMGGMTSLLGSLKWHLGEFLALTGWTLRGSDLVALGLVRHWMSPDALPFLELTAEKQLEVSESDAAMLLTEHSLPLPESSLLSGQQDAPGFKRSYIPLIEEIFSQPSLPRVMEALEKKTKQPETVQNSEFLQVCKDRLSRVDKRAAWMTQALIRDARDSIKANPEPPGIQRLHPTVLLEALRHELWAQTQLLARQDTIWGLHALCKGTTYRFGEEDVLLAEVEEATKAPEDFVFGIPERSEMPLSQHPRLRRYHPDYDSATGLDHDPVWMQQEVQRWDSELFDLERRQAIEDMLGDRDPSAFGLSRWVRVESRPG